MKNILVIDDDMRYRDVVLPYLQSYEFVVHEAATIDAGFKFLALNKYILLIVDGILPDGSGVEAIKRIRDSGNEVPIIFISALSKEKQELEELVSGLRVSLVKPKPVDPNELCRDVADIIRTAASPALRARPTAQLLQQRTVSAPRTGVPLLKPATENKFAGQAKPLLAAGFKSAADERLEAANSDFLSNLPKSLAAIRTKIEFYLCFPESSRDNVGDLIVQVHNIKGSSAMLHNLQKAAGTRGYHQITQLMERIEIYLRKVQNGTESLSDDSFQSIVEALRTAERDLV